MGYVFWCAACGNPDIIVEDTKSGYSMGKGIVGAAVLGPVGAVAGLDGKKTTSYYCPKCGARLDHCMPDYQVSNILTMLKNPEMYRSSIETAHERFPNMMLPKGWVSENSTGTASVPETITTQKILGKPDYSELKRILQTSKGSEAVDRIYAFFLKSGYISDDDLTDFRVGLGSFPTESPEYTLIRDAMNELEESYKLRAIFYHGQYVYEAARDREESKAWRYEALADKIPVDDYVEFVKDLISIKARTVKEVEQEIINKNPCINDDNPYTALSIAKRACLELRKKDGLISFDGEEIRKRSTKLAEEDLRWDTEERWRKSEVMRESVTAIRGMVPVMKSKNAVSLSELGGAVRTSTQQKMAVRLKQLVDAGYCSKQKIGGTVYYSLTPEAKAWTAKEFEDFIKAVQRTRFVGEDKKALAARKLKDKSGFSFFDIMGDEIKDSYEMQKFYECFMILELEGRARRNEHPSEYIWEYVDKNAVLREKLEKEKAQLLKEIEDYKIESNEKISKNNELLKEVQSRKFDDSEYIGKINELEQKKAGLSAKLSSLGFFKFSEKKQVNEEIAKCEQDLNEVQSRLASARQAFSDENMRLTTKYTHENDECNKTLSAKNVRLREIENKLSKL